MMIKILVRKSGARNKFLIRDQSKMYAQVIIVSIIIPNFRHICRILVTRPAG